MNMIHIAIIFHVIYQGYLGKFVTIRLWKRVILISKCSSCFVYDYDEKKPR